MRTRTWNTDLAILVRSEIGRTFVWGETDCVSLVRKAIVTLVGTDLIEPYVPIDYTNKEEAIAAFAQVGDFADVLSDIGTEVDIVFAGDGDILLNTDLSAGYQNVAIIFASKLLIADIESEEIKTVPFNRESHANIRVFRIPKWPM